MTSFLLVVFDGLRPDMMRPDTTPNLLRFAALGTRFAHARSVFPSETRVCSSSVVTGCHPDRHGVVANRFVHPRDLGRTVDTGSIEALRALEDELGAPLLQAPTLPELLAQGGRDCAVLSSGTTGQTFVLNPRADALGQLVISGHGPLACSEAGRRLFAELDPPPKAAPARAAWIAEVFRTRLLPDPPAATILWLCEPDTAGHYSGLGTPPHFDALRQTDAAFGRILDDWQAGPQRETLQVMVASDHGHATISGHMDVRAALSVVPSFAGCVVVPGSSGGIVVPGGAADRIEALAEWLTRQNWSGNVFAADGAELPHGVLPRSAVRINHSRSAHVLYTLRTSPAASEFGLPGTTLYDGGLARGAGTHGGLSGAEMRIVMMMAGGRVRPRTMSEWPAGLVDIAPTVLALLGLPGGVAMDGRVLTEALVDGEPPVASRSPETWEGAGTGYAQRVARTRVGTHVWIDEAARV